MYSDCVRHIPPSSSTEDPFHRLFADILAGTATTPEKYMAQGKWVQHTPGKFKAAGAVQSEKGSEDARAKVRVAVKKVAVCVFVRPPLRLSRVMSSCFAIMNFQVVMTSQRTVQSEMPDF